MGAFDEMIAKDGFPMYTLFIDLDPSQIDINVHPTKQEIKFEDEKIIYTFVKSAVKHALAQFSITPTLDFELDSSIQQLDAVSKPFTEERKSSVASSSLYNTFTQKNQAHFIENKSELKHWKDLYEPAKGELGVLNTALGKKNEVPLAINPEPGFISLQALTTQPVIAMEHLIQLHNTYIIVQNVVRVAVSLLLPYPLGLPQ